jgi:hypothetical protein
MKAKLLIAILFLTALVNAQVNTNISNYPLFDGEQFLAVSPNQSNVIIAWMQLKLNGKINIVVRNSTNGGLNWNSTYSIPNLYSNFTMADPSIAIANNGDAYLCYIEYKGQGTTDSGVVIVRKSTNGGTSWGNANVVRTISETSDLAVDRPWIAIDNYPASPNYGCLYVTSMPPKWATLPQNLHLKYSTNGGINWSSDILVSATGFPAYHGSMGIMAVSNDGTLNIAYVSLQGITPKFALAKTTNKGISFQRSYITNFYSLEDSLYQTSYSLTADPGNAGSLNFAYTAKINSDPDIFVVRTQDNGANWTNPYRVNNDPINNGIGQDMVWSVHKEYKYVLAWRDRRNGVAGSSSPFDVYYAISNDGGQTFTSNTKASSVTSPFNAMGTSGNDFLGLDLDGTFTRICWSDFRLGGINWDIFYFQGILPKVVNISSNIPDDYKLYQNYPNPFNPSTKIRFDISNSLTSGNEVLLNVYDLKGELVSTLVNENLSSGTYEVTFTSDNIASGVYFYKLTVNSIVCDVKKMILMR